MEKLYYQLPYVKRFEAEVLSCREGKQGFEVILDRTGFYPEGGGQPSDTGTLGGIKVTMVREKGEEIIHYTEEALEPGTKVEGILNWEERFSNMQQHSGEHIVSGLIHEIYGYDNVGFHMGREEVTIDLNGTLTWEQLMEIERKANEMVYENIPVVITYPSKEELESLDYRSKKELTGQVRIVEVPGADRCACCGTHVEKTGEIGAIQFLSMIHYKAGVRISLLCGRRAMEDHIRKTEQTIVLTEELSSKPDRIVEAVERMKQESAQKESVIVALTRELLEMKAEFIEKGKRLLLIFENGLAPVQIRQFCNLLLEGEKAEVICVCSGSDAEGYSYCAASRSLDMRQAGKVLNEKLSGRGGGNAQMIQGTFKASEEQIREGFGQAL